MNVASLELCKELYELSGWGSTLDQLDDIWGVDSEGNTAVITSKEYANGENKIGIPIEVFPAYGLSFTIRNLPPMRLEKSSEGYRTDYFRDKDSFVGVTEAETPEDALAKLAIKLFKENILTKEI